MRSLTTPLPPTGCFYKPKPPQATHLPGPPGAAHWTGCLLALLGATTKATAHRNCIKRCTILPLQPTCQVHQVQHAGLAALVSQAHRQQRMGARAVCVHGGGGGGAVAGALCTKAWVEGDAASTLMPGLPDASGGQFAKLAGRLVRGSKPTLRLPISTHPPAPPAHPARCPRRARSAPAPAPAPVPAGPLPCQTPAGGQCTDALSNQSTATAMATAGSRLAAGQEGRTDAQDCWQQGRIEQGRADTQACWQAGQAGLWFKEALTSSLAASGPAASRSRSASL